MNDALSLIHPMHISCIVLATRVLPPIELCVFCSGQGGSRAAHLASKCSIGNCGQIPLKYGILRVLVTFMPQHQDLTTMHDQEHNKLYSTCVHVISVGERHELILQVIRKASQMHEVAFCMHDASATTN